jgi:protein CpxP
MKKLIISSAFVLFVLVARTQLPPPQPPSIEERLKHTHEMLQKEVQPSTTQQSEIEATFKIFFMAEDKLRKENPPPPPPPPDPKVKEAMDKLLKERDDKIKKILSDDQFKKFKEAEKKLHPPMPGEKGNSAPPPPAQQ